MIGLIGIGLAGFLSVGVINGLFGSASFYIIGLVCGLLFLYLSIKKHNASFNAFLLGFSLAIDSVSSNRPGLGLLLGACILALSYFAPQILRFTTPLAQVIVGLFLVTSLYSLLVYGVAGFIHRFFLLLPVLLGLSAYSWFVFRSINDTPYEII